MSSSNFLNTVPIFQGAQSTFYLINGIKYHLQFPIGWALNHKSHYCSYINENIGTGPIECTNCANHGSLRGVFIGYCGNCLQQYSDNGEWRGNKVALGLSVETTDNAILWHKYPYMSNIPKEEIGDEEGADLTDLAINFDEFEQVVANLDEDEQNTDEENTDDEDEDADE